MLCELFALFYSCGYITPYVGTIHNVQAQTLVHPIDWIEENYTEAITLEQLCALTKFSKNYLCRIFKEYTSKTIVEYINELHIDNASFTLSETDSRITSAAFDCAFKDFSYFCKLFKRCKGITPKEYTRQHDTPAKR